MLIVFVKEDLLPHIRHMSAESVGTGLMGMMVNILSLLSCFLKYTVFLTLALTCALTCRPGNVGLQEIFANFSVWPKP
jgi:hypothetical protein